MPLFIFLNLVIFYSSLDFPDFIVFIRASQNLTEWFIQPSALHLVSCFWKIIENLFFFPSVWIPDGIQSGLPSVWCRCLQPALLHDVQEDCLIALPRPSWYNSSRAFHAKQLICLQSWCLTDQFFLSRTELIGPSSVENDSSNSIIWGSSWRRPSTFCPLSSFLISNCHPRRNSWRSASRFHR